ncbi:O-acetylhomoserine aminocarboxypropyltransferase/cysteine synthase family protein [Myxococcota bacterium]
MKPSSRHPLLSLDTLLVHGGYRPHDHARSRMVPIYQTAAFCYDSVDHAARLFALEEPGFIYSRIGNPTVEFAERRLAVVEKGVAAVAFASGMAAATALVLNCLRPGDEILAANCLYGGTIGLFGDTLPTLGIRTRFFDPLDASSLAAVDSPAVRLIFVENLANPRLAVPDYEMVTRFCRQRRLPLVVDNTIATPYLTTPADYGADLVLHSCTKYLEGHGAIIGGMIIDRGSFEWDRDRYPLLFEAAPNGKPYVEAYGQLGFTHRLRGKVLMNTGGCMAPMNAYLLVHGMESLHVRMARHCENARRIAQALSSDPRVAYVVHPSLPNHPSHATASRYLRDFGAMLGFGLRGGFEACKRFIDRVELLTHGTNIGDTKTLVIHSASTTHRNVPLEQRIAAGIGDDFIRVSVGLEAASDLLAAIDSAVG